MGANGAGKSNIFRAVEFVLSATTGNETEKIKHHSFVNQKETATFVEIVLDNSDAVLLVKVCNFIYFTNLIQSLN